MDHSSRVNGDDLWAWDGPVAAACHALNYAYEPRSDQILFSTLVEKGLSRQRTQPVGILPIEAGTGIGKTLAYLVPGALHISEGYERMLVSTHTIALGIQILRKDGPIALEVARALTGKRLRIAHMRGRSHFVSPSRARAYGNLLRDDGLPAKAWQPYVDLADGMMSKITHATEALALGDLSDETTALVEGALLERIQETSSIPLSIDDICLLASSPADELAIHKLSRAIAGEANILVTTHAYTAIALARRALFDADKQPFSLLVVDEADQWASAAASVSLVQTSMNELRSSVQDIVSANRHASAPIELITCGVATLKTIDALAAFAPTGPHRIEPITRHDPAIDLLLGLTQQIDKLIYLAARRRSHTAAAADQLQKKCDDLKTISRALQGNETDFWMPRWTTSKVHGLPSIGITGRAPGRIIKRLWLSVDGAPPLAKTVILTSATLSTPGYRDTARWKAIEIATGADPSSGMVLSDLATSIQPKQFGMLRVCFADPRAPIPRLEGDGKISSDALGYCVSVIKAAIANSALKDGRTLVLVPSYADVQQLSSLIPNAMQHNQGMSMQKVLKNYSDEPGCCLITPGAWVGADLPGLIQNLVIVRIPYPPQDPHRDLNGAGLLSATLVKLAQGIGRAIRCNTDDVVLWFADPRMPIPENVTEETGLLPSPYANSILLSAIPKRFRDCFGRAPGAACIGVSFVPIKEPPTDRMVNQLQLSRRRKKKPNTSPVSFGVTETPSI